MRVRSFAVFLLFLVLAVAVNAQTPLTTSRVFVSSTAYDGNLGGLAGADAKCQARANAASLGGTWMAWLSDSTQTASACLTHATGPYKRLDGITIANDWTDLTDSSLLAGIDRDEFNTTATNLEVWTGTGSGGVGSGGCFDWTSNSPDGSFPAVGLSGLITAGWSNSYLQFCDRLERLYCFQLPVPEPAITGTVTYGNAIGVPVPRFVSNVTITGSGSPTLMTTTAAPGATAGQYTLSGFGSGSYTITPTKTGGANGAINSFDAAKVAAHVAGTSLLTGNQIVVADASGNGTVNSFDAAQIARYVTSSPPYGITGTWKFLPLSRTYSSITGDLTAQDYAGLLMGDVSGNWTNTGARPTNTFDPNALSWLMGSGF